MTYRILYTNSYNQRAGRFLKRHPDLLSQYEKTLKLLELHPFHPSLRLHQLKERLGGLHSVSINIAYRITLEFIIEEETIIPVDVGKHGKVY
jgi:mRNA-degrading endonuclease YafQ of YafQ-DinJ toxin-antitoxin module